MDSRLGHDGGQPTLLHDLPHFIEHLSEPSNHSILSTMVLEIHDLGHDVDGIPDEDWLQELPFVNPKECRRANGRVERA